jgi:hypothetical protein
LDKGEYLQCGVLRQTSVVSVETVSDVSLTEFIGFQMSCKARHSSEHHFQNLVVVTGYHLPLQTSSIRLSNVLPKWFGYFHRSFENGGGGFQAILGGQFGIITGGQFGHNKQI